MLSEHYCCLGVIIFVTAPQGYAPWNEVLLPQVYLWSPVTSNIDVNVFKSVLKALKFFAKHVLLA